jgi:hypothetical protein
MVVHTCNRCKIEFSKKSHYVYHINRKYPCKEKQEENILINAKKEVEQTIITPNTPNPPEILINSPKISPKSLKLTCINCNKIFARSDGLKRHIESRCKILKKKEETDNLLLQKIKELEEENKVIKQKINILETTNNKLVKPVGKNNNQNITIINNGNINNTTNCNNTTNNITNNINIANFGTLDHKKIDNKVFYNSLIKYSGLTPLLKFIEYIHKNEKFPEYKNVEINDLARNLGRFIEDNKWKLSDANEIVDKVIDETYNYYEVKFNELEEEIDKKPQTEKTKIKRNKRFINTMRGNEHFDQNDDGDFVDDDGKYVTVKDFQEGRKFEDKLKKKVKCSLKK